MEEKDIHLDLITEDILKTVEGNVCPICSSIFELGEEAAATVCRHYFHVSCLGRWLDQKSGCPVCRR